MTQELILFESNYHEDHDDFGDFIIKFGNPKEHKITIENKEPLNEELNHFIECILNNTTPLTNGEAGLKALEIALEAMESMNMSSIQKNKTI